MSEVIRQASAAHHYLVVFDNHTECPLYLGRSRRLASAAQRIVLYARDRGCTFPGCTAPAYHSEVHHATADWADGGQTDIVDETLACGRDNRRVRPGGWRTRKRKDGRTEWIPPPNLDTGQARVNNYHHPERYLIPDEAPTMAPTTRAMATSYRGSGLRFNVQAGIQCVTDRRRGPYATG